MIYNSSSCLRASTLTARITPRSVTPIWSPKSCVAQPILKQQARCLSTSPIFTKNGQTSTFRPFYKHADKAPGLSKVFSIRFASTSASPIVPANDPSPSLPESPYQPLTWEAYLSLRQKRRYYNVIASSLTALGTFAGGASFLLAQDIEKISGFMFGLDPFIAMGLVCFGFGAMGWLLGPFAGGSLFRLVHRRVNRSMQAKEKDFYRRIKKHRSDPAGQSMSNPVPDYYGEKIFSVKGYRQWLKDQRAFRKKRESLT